MMRFSFLDCLSQGGWCHINSGTWDNVHDAGFDHTASQRGPDAWWREPIPVTHRANARAHGLRGHVLHDPIPGREGRGSRRRFCGRRGDQLTALILFLWGGGSLFFFFFQDGTWKKSFPKWSRLHWNNQPIMLPYNYNHPHPRCIFRFFLSVKQWRTPQWDTLTYTLIKSDEGRRRSLNALFKCRDTLTKEWRRWDDATVCGGARDPSQKDALKRNYRKQCNTNIQRQPKESACILNI